jgi:hypothetical protein
MKKNDFFENKGNVGFLLFFSILLLLVGLFTIISAFI